MTRKTEKYANDKIIICDMWKKNLLDSISDVLSKDL